LPRQTSIRVGSRMTVSPGTQDWKERSAESNSR